MARFVVSKISTAAINRDGTELIIRVTDGAGEDRDIVTSQTGLEDILNALNEAATKAFARRRENGIVEAATDPGNGELLNCLGFCFAFAEDRSHMRLQLQTTVGRIDILVPAVHADAFRDVTIQNVPFRRSSTTSLRPCISWSAQWRPDGDRLAVAARELTAVACAAVIGLPLRAVLALFQFPGRRLAAILLSSLMGMFPVVVGLVVYLLISRSGPLGVFGLLFTPTAMIVAQVVIVTPIIAALTRRLVEDLWSEYRE